MQRPPLEFDLRGALDRRSHRGAPREADLAVRQRRVAQQEHERAGQRVASSVASSPLANHTNHQIVILSLRRAPDSRVRLAAPCRAAARGGIRVRDCRGGCRRARRETAKRQRSTCEGWRRRSRRRSARAGSVGRPAARRDHARRRHDRGRRRRDPRQARDDDEAAAMLRRLAGRRHEVLTGVSIRHGAHEVGRVESTAVWFSALTTKTLPGTWQAGKGATRPARTPFRAWRRDSFPRIEGSYANVVGLPVAAVAELLRCGPCVRTRSTGYSDD